MKPGDLIQRRHVCFKPSSIGVLLEEPTFPRYGNYPKRYKVLTENGIEEWEDERKVLIETVEQYLFE